MLLVFVVQTQDANTEMESERTPYHVCGSQRWLETML